MRTYRYARIADDLRQQIERGDFEQVKLPSERTLMVSYGVQRSTVRRALSLLGDEGRIVRASKRGSFVNREPAGFPLTPNEDDPPRASPVAGTVLVVAQWRITSPALEGLLGGLNQTLANSELTLQTFDSRPKKGSLKPELPDKGYLDAHQIKAIVLWPAVPADRAALMELRDSVPLVLIDREVSGLETHSVVFDDYGGGKAVTSHLIEQGHTRIGFLTDEVFAETVQQRWRGYVDALEAAGIVGDPACYGLYAGIHDPPYTELMRLLLRGAGYPLTAVVCSNDAVALNFLQFLQREHKRVPGDIAVTGFGNLLPSSLEAARLTTVRQPFDVAGQIVGRLLMERVFSSAPNAARGAIEQVRVPVELIVRASSSGTGQ